MFRTFSLKRVISGTLVAKQIPVNHVQKYINSRLLDIFKVVISKEHEPECRKNRWDLSVFLS
jgi:hypothetical protein